LPNSGVKIDHLAAVGVGTLALEIDSPVRCTAEVEALVFSSTTLLSLVGHVGHPLDSVVDEIVRIGVFVVPLLDSPALYDDFIDLKVGDVAACVCTFALLGRRIILGTLKST
jgi:hypothetical protein